MHAMKQDGTISNCERHCSLIHAPVGSAHRADAKACHVGHSNMSGASRLYSRGPFCLFGGTRRSVSSFAKASEDTRCAFLHSFIHPP